MYIINIIILIFLLLLFLFLINLFYHKSLSRLAFLHNTSLNLLLKCPSALYSLIYLCFAIVKLHSQNLVVDFPRFIHFYIDIYIESNLCKMLLKLSDFLYFLCISIQLFFYKHYDKKFSLSFKNTFFLGKKSK